eukprot:CAMPEP_0194289036 /NCGR_PEP_ID=MMETSP0169-20130528/38201_1 /TAXON_ID=218684 /ORGANISM="Corethron pennatum, Strain L29A3" /LENGTH=144 /DNA_ID=CAMNT_0039036213 /DNA_START=117 /DNA_END=551 /DNA_ORIENTATION=+
MKVYFSLSLLLILRGTGASAVEPEFEQKSFLRKAKIHQNTDSTESTGLHVKRTVTEKYENNYTQDWQQLIHLEDDIYTDDDYNYHNDDTTKSPTMSSSPTYPPTETLSPSPTLSLSPTYQPTETLSPSPTYISTMNPTGEVAGK